MVKHYISEQESRGPEKKIYQDRQKTTVQIVMFSKTLLVNCENKLIPEVCQKTIIVPTYNPRKGGNENFKVTSDLVFEQTPPLYHQEQTGLEKHLCV